MRVSYFFLVSTLWLSACAAWRLRPDNPDHKARKVEVTAKLGVGESTLNTVLRAEQDECDSLDARVTGLTIGTEVVGVLGGGAGITSPMLSEQAPRWVIAGLSLLFSATSILTGGLAAHYSSVYSHRCAVNTGGR